MRRQVHARMRRLSFTKPDPSVCNWSVARQGMPVLYFIDAVTGKRHEQGLDRLCDDLTDDEMLLWCVVKKYTLASWA